MNQHRSAPFALACLAAVAVVSTLLAGCNGGTALAEAYTAPTGGDAERGRAAIVHFDCGSCHTIPGVQGADGRVAPPLEFFSRRTFIGGELPNTPDNLVHWIQDPKSVEAGTAMPTLGVSEQQARDIAAYLYTLK